MATVPSVLSRSALQPCDESFSSRATLPGDSVWVCSLRTLFTGGELPARQLLPRRTFSELAIGCADSCSADRAGLWKETLLLDLLVFSSLSFTDSGSSMTAHCWLTVASLFFLTVATFCFLAGPVTAKLFLPAAVFLITFFFLLPVLEI